MSRSTPEPCRALLPRAGVSLASKVALCAAALLIAFASPASSQQVVTIGQTPVCAACDIILEPVARLGAASDPAGFGPLVQVAVSSDGRFAVSSSTFVGSIFIYDANGRFVRSMGRRGGGPGEFQRPVNLAFGRADSLHVFELGGSRYTVFDADLGLARSAMLPGRVHDFALDPTGRILAAAPVVVQGRRYALQLLSPEAERIAALNELPVAEAAPGSDRRYVAFGPDGRAWSVAPTAYDVRVRGRNAGPPTMYRATRAWLATEPLPLALDPLTQRPPGQISGITVDDAGLVWVFATVAASDWRPRPEATEPPDISEIFDTIIEVLEPRSGALVTRKRSNRVLFPLRSGMAYAIVPDALGDSRIHVWRLSLEGRN